MIRSTEIELHKRAQKLFEDENPGRYWRFSAELRVSKLPSNCIAGLIERQLILSRVRAQMKKEGMWFETWHAPSAEG